ncbi:MAG: hypothetical protein QOJ15_1313 [Bradyrhizobium sp.]|nr:hypothetical protein [Bradyrhizobium sp.]
MSETETDDREHHRLVVHEEPKVSRYVAAGAPRRCQHEACSKPFDGYCLRNGDHYFCSEVCAQVGMPIDFENVVKLRGRS